MSTGSIPVLAAIDRNEKVMFNNSLKQGNAGLGQAIAYFTKNNYGIALPLTDSEDWDLIASKDGKLLKLQVKTSGKGKEKYLKFQ